jgi:hypothetical protein
VRAQEAIKGPECERRLSRNGAEQFPEEARGHGAVAVVVEHFKGAREVLAVRVGLRMAMSDGIQKSMCVVCVFRAHFSKIVIRPDETE